MNRVPDINGPDDGSVDWAIARQPISGRNYLTAQRLEPHAYRIAPLRETHRPIVEPVGPQRVRPTDRLVTRKDGALMRFWSDGSLRKEALTVTHGG